LSVPMAVITGYYRQSQLFTYLLPIAKIGLKWI
jgi:hypothetical protein